MGCSPRSLAIDANITANKDRDEIFIAHLLDRQARRLPIRVYEHLRALQLIDRKKLGMDGFKYCSVDDARESFLGFKKFS